MIDMVEDDDIDREVSDRREHPRHPIELKVEYKRLNTFFADYTKNICKGGTFIRTDKPLDVGTEFIFKLYIPRLTEPIRLHGQVKWIVLPGEEQPGTVGSEEAGMGIRFIYKSGGERRQIEGQVEKLMIDSLGQLLYTKLMHSGDDDDAGGDTGDGERGND